MSILNGEDQKVVHVVLLVAPKTSGKSFYAAALARMALRRFAVQGGWRMRCAEQWVVNDSKSRNPKDQFPDIRNTVVHSYHEKALNAQSTNMTDGENLFFYEIYHPSRDPTNNYNVVLVDTPGGWVFEDPGYRSNQPQLVIKDIVGRVQKEGKDVWGSQLSIKLSMILFFNSALDGRRQLDQFPRLSAKSLIDFRQANSSQKIDQYVLYYTAADYLPGLQGANFEQRLHDFNNDRGRGSFMTMRDYISPGTWEFIRYIGDGLCDIDKESSWSIRYGSAVGACPDGSPNWVPITGRDTEVGVPGKFKYPDLWQPLEVLEPLLICCGATHGH